MKESTVKLRVIDVVQIESATRIRESLTRIGITVIRNRVISL